MTLEIVDAVIEIEGEVELVTETRRIYQMPSRTATPDPDIRETIRGG